MNNESRLTLIKDLGKNVHGAKIGLYQCVCGNTKVIIQYDVRVGETLSCGCLRRSIIRTHNLSRTRIYSTYQGMKERCYNRSNPRFKNYGGRGIVVCKEWLDSSSAFIEWALSNGYADHLQIDRINVNGNYCPENCRWVSSKQNANNRTNNVFIEFNGFRKTIAEWAAHLGIPKGTLQNRIKTYKWSIERSLTEPVCKK